MKVTDLMVGDWVNYKSPSSGKLQPVKIKNIYGVEFNCEVEYWNIKSGYSISDTEPIKLTEDILVKNGFKHSMPYNDWTNADCNFYLYEGGNGYCISNTDIKLDYVHQLQHLLRLCGIEKEIEL